MIPLLHKDGKYADFKIEITSCNDVSIHFEIFEARAWKDNVQEWEEYARVIIKWDGCSEISLDSLHLCGKFFWKKHCEIMEWVYKVAFPLIPGHIVSEEWTDETSKPI
jgi:hypothetical protein